MLVWASLCPETPKLRWSRPFLVCQLVNAIWSGMRIRALWELDSLVLSLNQSPEETMTHRLMLLGFGVIGTLRFVVSCLWIETFWVANRLVHFCQALIMILSIIALWWLDSPVIILGNPELKGRDVILATRLPGEDDPAGKSRDITELAYSWTIRDARSRPKLREAMRSAGMLGNRSTGPARSP